jgi:hypothetical protein
MPLIDLAQLNSAKRARDKAAAFYLFDPNVTLIDVGFRINEQAGNQITNELAARVHLRQKLRGPAFEAFAERSPERVIDEGRVGFPVDIIKGNYRLHSQLVSRSQPLLRSGFFNPIFGGISISNERGFGSYGTLGGKVKDRKTGTELILSNWHVLVGSAFAKPNLRICQPGLGDGGNAFYTIARLTRHAMNDGIDAAVAEISGSRAVINQQLGLGPVSGLTSPKLGLRVTKSGRASEVTEGIIDGVDGVVTIPYGNFNRIVRHVVHIAQTPEGGNVSSPGDSGSWWLEKETKKAVALHFAGDNDPEYGLAISMPQVLDALNVDIAL